MGSKIKQQQHKRKRKRVTVSWWKSIKKNQETVIETRLLKKHNTVYSSLKTKGKPSVS